MSRRNTGIDWLVIIVTLLGLAIIWTWTIPSALNAQRERKLLAKEGVLTHGQVLSKKDPFWHDPSTGDIIEYQFADSADQVWRGRGEGYLSIETGTGEKVLLVTYAQSDPSVNRLGNHTEEYMRRRLETGATTFLIFILVVQGGGLSCLLIWLARRATVILDSIKREIA